MNKIYKDLNESEYVFRYFELELYFSSMFYYKKFKKEYFNFIKNETDKLKIKLRCNINCDKILLLLLYKKIEKRGFRAIYGGIELDENYNISIIIVD